MKKTKGPKKLFLTEDELKNIRSRQALYNEHQFYMYMTNNEIVNYLKGVIYKRLGLDTTKDYALSSDSTYLIIEEKHDTK